MVKSLATFCCSGTYKMCNQSAADKGYRNMETKAEVNPELYKKEFAILNGLYEWLSFDIYEQSLYCEVHFFKQWHGI